MKLTFKDRIYLSGVLPKEGGMIEMITVRGIFSKVEITSDEIQKHNIKDSEKGVTWQSEEDIEVVFSDTEKEIIKSAIKRMDEEKRISIDMLPTLEKLHQM